MPELPEVDAITRVVRRHAIGGTIRSIEVIRGPHYFNGPTDQPRLPREGLPIVDVYRVGKYVMMKIANGMYIQTHNAMTGYFDWDVEPWTFDYVEGKRKSQDSDIRVKFIFEFPSREGPPVRKTLRFHDSRLFGRIQTVLEHPTVGPELLETPGGFDRPIVALKDFATGIYGSTQPVKSLLMNQEFIAGVGNIYASESLHLAGIDPRIISNRLNPVFVEPLLESLRLCVSFCIPKITYDWLKVYRRDKCGTCSHKVTRCEIKGRATFLCERCQF